MRDVQVYYLGVPPDAQPVVLKASSCINSEIEVKRFVCEIDYHSLLAFIHPVQFMSYPHGK